MDRVLIYDGKTCLFDSGHVAACGMAGLVAQALSETYPKRRFEHDADRVYWLRKSEILYGTVAKELSAFAAGFARGVSAEQDRAPQDDPTR